MKGDEAVEIQHQRCDSLLFVDARIGKFDLGDILVVDMDHRFTLGAFGKLTVSTSVGNSERKIIWVNTCIGSNYI